ncbi:MAG: hypothetical protein HZB15_03480 [Actinobacteria bacterium]|nr:hypothetical protein [Actinomycetota bacterium]
MESSTIPAPSPWPAPANTPTETTPARAVLAAPTASPVPGLTAHEWQVARLQAAQWHADRQAAQLHIAAARQRQLWMPPGFASAPPPPPSRRHRRRAAIVAVLVLAAMAAAATLTVVLRDDAAAAAYSLDMAAIDVQDTSTVTYDLDMSTSDGMDLHYEIAMDLDRELSSITMDTDGTEWVYVMDLGDGVVYVDAAAMETLGADVADADWVSFDLDDMVGSDEDITGVYGLGENPLDATGLFDQAEEVDDLGFEDINGQEVKHYEVTFDEEDLLGFDTSDLESSDLGADLHTSGFVNDGETDPEGKVVYDVYVNEWNEIVQLTYGMDFLGEWVSVDLTVTSVDEAVDIEVPRSSTVIDGDDLFDDDF